MFNKIFLTLITCFFVSNISTTTYAYQSPLSPLVKKITTETKEKTYLPPLIKGTKIVNGKVILTEEKLLFLNEKAKGYKQRYGLYPMDKDAFWIYISDFTSLDEIPLKYDDFDLFRGCGYIAFSAETNNISIILEKNHFISNKGYWEIIRTIGISPDVNLFVFKE